MSESLGVDAGGRCHWGIRTSDALRAASLVTKPLSSTLLSRGPLAQENPMGRIGGHCRPVLEPHEVLLRSLGETKSGIALAEIQAELRARGIPVQGFFTIHHALRRLDLTHKNRTCGRPTASA